MIQQENILAAKIVRILFLSKLNISVLGFKKTNGLPMLMVVCFALQVFKAV